MTGLLASAPLAADATNFTAIVLGLGVPLVVCGAIAVIVVAILRVRAHRTDVGAMDHYRRLAEDAITNQQELRAELARLTLKVEAVEKLMRDVG